MWNLLKDIVLLILLVLQKITQKSIDYLLTVFTCEFGADSTCMTSLLIQVF